MDELRPPEAQLLAGTRPGEDDWGSDPDEVMLHLASGTQTVPSCAGDQRRFYTGVIDRLRNDGPGPGTTIEALAVMAVIEAGSISARTAAAALPQLTEDERAAWASAAGRSADPC